MTFPDTSPEPRPRPPRRPLLVLAGLALFGLALALLLFGGTLRGRNGAAANQSTILEQVSPFQVSTPIIADIPTGGGGPAKVGDTAPPFALYDLDGNLVRLADFHGRPVIVNFWATWCAPCRIEMPELQAAYEAHQAAGLVILALNQDEPADLARRFFHDEMALTFTALLDEHSAVSSRYDNLGALPTTYFVSPDGRVTALHRGPMSQSQIDAYLEQTVATGR